MGKPVNGQKKGLAYEITHTTCKVTFRLDTTDIDFEITPETKVTKVADKHNNHYKIVLPSKKQRYIKIADLNSHEELREILELTPSKKRQLTEDRKENERAILEIERNREMRETLKEFADKNTAESKRFKKIVAQHHQKLADYAYTLMWVNAFENRKRSEDSN